MNALQVSGLDVRLGDLHILRAIDLEVPFGELHVLMGPNGSGKSTLCHALMGRPGYEVSGVAAVGGVDLLGRDVVGRAAAGLFEVFQYPVEIPGVTLGDLLAEMAAAVGPEVAVRAAVALEQLDTAGFVDRSVNVGLSGGEKKRSEMTQLLALAPRMAILDELDSGLDVDAVREVATAVEAMRHPGMGVLVITHYTRVLRYLEVDRVHVMLDGHIVESGGRALADRLDAEGYDGLRRRVGLVQPDVDPFLKGL
ncbi:MAG: Fe-S cluster assembly ATPase SufC [Actinobacteria bacterium RBG_16_67_15]|nr:MAG: Fe-S cluster assembly ATPase SufC [Actinobacteria bacterium RBG_16_67_15]